MGFIGHFGKDLRLRDHVLPLSGRSCLVAVLNVTPDSFSDGGNYLDPGRAVERAIELESQGADVIDVGGESSRPGSLSVSVSEELDRVIPVVRAIRKKCKVVISVDTCKSEVAKRALDCGAEIINDITALSGDSEMAKVIAAARSAVCLMHMKGRPVDMQSDPSYVDVVKEIMDHLSSAIKTAEDSGISPEMILVDPGIGFGKSLEHNLEILRKLFLFKTLKKPIMIGTSRKRFIGELTGKEPNERVFGTAATVCAAAFNGANLFRVHDVPEMREILMVADALKGEV